MLLAAALETVLLAGFALLATHAGRGSVTVDAFMRLNSLLVKPLGLLQFAAPLGRQLAALLLYGALLAALTAAVAWLDRRQALGY